MKTKQKKVTELGTDDPDFFEKNKKIINNGGAVFIRKSKKPISIEERKRKQYQDALEKRSDAQYGIRAAEKHLAEYKIHVLECQNRISVMEYLFSNMRNSQPVIEQFLIESIEEENSNIKKINDDSKFYRDSLRSHKKNLDAAEKLITSLIENGPDMQNTFDDGDDYDGEPDYPDNKSHAAGR